MLSNYPAIGRATEMNRVTFGLLTPIGIAQRVTEVQITWLIEPEAQLPNAKIPPPPPWHSLGGVSGGPLISWFESNGHIATYALPGIIVEHPDYEQNAFNVEWVVAVREDCISDSGRVGQ